MFDSRKDITTESLGSRMLNVERQQMASTENMRLERIARSLVPWLVLASWASMALTFSDRLPNLGGLLGSFRGLLTGWVAARRLIKPQWLRRFDRKLLESHPLLWLAGIHRFWFELAVGGILPFGALLLLLKYDSENDQLFKTLSGSLQVAFVILLLVSAPLAWMVGYRRRNIPGPILLQVRQVTVAFSLVVLPEVILAVAAVVGVSDGWDRLGRPEELAALPLAGLALGLPLVSVALAVSLEGLGAAVYAVVLNVLLMLLIPLPGYATSIGIAAVPSIWAIAVAYFLAVGRKHDRPEVRRKVGNALVSSAGVAISHFIFMVVAVLRNMDVEWPGYQQALLTDFVGYACAALVYFAVLVPVVRDVVRCAAEPR
jgi:hypothetical protein